MIKFSFKLLTIFVCVTSITTANARPPLPQFESPEHRMMGDLVELQFDLNTSAKAGYKLKLPNGLTLSYGEIVALGGDFYGIPNAPISIGKTNKERKQRFIQAYNSLSQDKNAVSESAKILSVIKNEEAQIDEGVQQGEDPAAIYAQNAQDSEIAWNCITGGLCPADVPWMSKEMFKKVYYYKEGRYLNLLDTNFDHFAKGAWLAYSAGHEVALKKAALAGQTHDLGQLTEAYAMNAFANHYLSDSFSSGHMRTPHLELYNTVLPATVGSLLAGFMHKEDGDNGLLVSNARGDTWIAYGDGHYLDERNQQNRDLLQSAMQASADEIFAAYIQGETPNTDLVSSYLPDLDKLAFTRETQENISPLFYWDESENVLMRRKQINNPFDFEWTPDWNGWMTLLEISNTQQLTAIQQSILLAHPDSKNDAINKGLITDKEILKTFNTP